MNPSTEARREMRDFYMRDRKRRLMTQNLWVRFLRWMKW